MKEMMQTKNTPSKVIGNPETIEMEISEFSGVDIDQTDEAAEMSEITDESGGAFAEELEDLSKLINSTNQKLKILDCTQYFDLVQLKTLNP